METKEKTQEKPVQEEVKKEVKKEVIKDPIDDVLKGYTEEAETDTKQVNADTISDTPPIFDEPPKKKRGRPKGSSKKKDSSSRFTETVEGNEIVNGMLLLFFIDTAIPMAISFINNRYSRSKIKPTDLKLTAKQKSELEPIANEVARQIAISGNPMTVFVISLMGIYAGNYFTKIYS